MLAGQDQPRFRLGVYFEGSMLNDKNLKDFFGHSQRNLPGVEASVHTLYNIDVWASYRVYRDETETTFFGNVDKLKINQASLGIIYRPVVWKVLEPFIGAGLEFYSYSEKVEGDSDIPDTSGNAMGFHVQAGTHVNILKFLAAKVFFRLNGVKKTLDNPLPDGNDKLDLGGKEFGVGLVFKF
jgi:opacity protein-like surface antigen